MFYQSLPLELLPKSDELELLSHDEELEYSGIHVGAANTGEANKSKAMVVVVIETINFFIVAIWAIEYILF